MSTIEYRQDDLLKAEAEALVNTVNSVGVMGKGIALQFKKAFPDNFLAYEAACRSGQVGPGRMFVYETGQLTEPRLIINFPTKKHWRSKTEIEYVDEGLLDLVRVIQERKIRSIAIPPLGCGNGGLNWSDVKPRIEQALGNVPDLKVMIYPPQAPPSPKDQRVGTKRPRMNASRAAFISVFAAYKRDPAAIITRLVAQKLAYFLQSAGEPLKLNFVKGKYGPYSEALNHVLIGMEGHFTKGYGDRVGASDIEVEARALKEAEEFVPEGSEEAKRIRRVEELIEGFESPFGLELLSTVHWSVAVAGMRSPEDVLSFVGDWTPEKRAKFDDRFVSVALDRLRTQEWLSSSN